jgi:hypothetical protein
LSSYRVHYICHLAPAHGPSVASIRIPLLSDYQPASGTGRKELV